MDILVVYAIGWAVGAITVYVHMKINAARKKVESEDLRPPRQ